MSTLVGLAVSGKGDTCSTSSNSTPAPSQGLYQPTGLAIDSSNNLYIADSKHNCVRMLANGAAGVTALTTVAGTCGSAASTTPNPNGLASRLKQQSVHLHSGHRSPSRCQRLSGPSPGAKRKPLCDGRCPLRSCSKRLLGNHRKRRAERTLRPGDQWHGRSLYRRHRQQLRSPDSKSHRPTRPPSVAAPTTTPATLRLP